MFRCFKMRKRVLLKCCALLGVVTLTVSYFTSSKTTSSGGVQTRMAADVAEQITKTRRSGGGDGNIETALNDVDFRALASVLRTGLEDSGGDKNTRLKDHVSKLLDDFENRMSEKEIQDNEHIDTMEKHNGGFDHIENQLQETRQDYNQAGHLRDDREGQDQEELFILNRVQQQQEQEQPHHQQREEPQLKAILANIGQEKQLENAQHEAIAAAEDLDKPPLLPLLQPAVEAEPARQNVAPPAPRPKAPAAASTGLKRKRVRVIRKTIRAGKVIREEVIGVKTMIVDDNGTPIKDQQNAYDHVWYSDILNGHYQAHVVRLRNQTREGPFLTEQLWKFGDPNSERMFLYHRMLQHDWKLNYTNIYNLRRELLDSDINAHRSLIITRENSPLGSPLPLYAGSRIMINKTIQHVYTYNVTSTLRRHVPGLSPFRNKMYKRCAVVGNSGSLLNSSCGKEIDSFDMVFRCNAAPIPKYAKDAGWRSNITTFNPSIFNLKFNGARRPEDRLQFQKDITQYNGYLWMTCIGAAGHYNTCLSVVQSDEPRQPGEPQLVVAHPQQFVNFWNFWKERNFTNQPSTGFFMAHAAIQMCEETHLYGFWPFPLRVDTSFKRVPYHYFDDILLGKKHGMNQEFSTALQYHELGIIRLHAGKCAGG